jgi:hypothetical protein
MLLRMPSSAGRSSHKRPFSLPTLQLPRRDLPFEPRNEAGVAVLFGHLAEKLEFKVVTAHTRVPDLTVTRRGKRIRVELEFSSKGFRREARNGDWKKCDLVVCWKHDWGSFPPGIPVYELRKVYGIGWNVWIQPMWGEFADRLPRGKQIGDPWSVPSMAGLDDLLLIYRPKSDPQQGGDGEVREIVRVRSAVERVDATWRDGKDWMGAIQRVATLDEPLSFRELKSAGVKPKSLQGRPPVSPTVWRRLRDHILETNSGLRHGRGALGGLQPGIQILAP